MKEIKETEVDNLILKATNEVAKRYIEGAIDIAYTKYKKDIDEYDKKINDGVNKYLNDEISLEDFKNILRRWYKFWIGIFKEVKND